MLAIRTIIVSILAMSFFLEDLLLLTAFQEAPICCIEGAGKEKSSDCNEKNSEYEKDDIKIVHHHNSVMPGFDINANYFSRGEKAYAEFCLEVYSPPPEVI